MIRWQCSCLTMADLGSCHDSIHVPPGDGNGWHRNNPSQRRVLQKSYAREQSGGGGTDVRRPIRPDGQETSMEISGVLSFQVPPIWIYMAQTWLANPCTEWRFAAEKSPNIIPS